MFLNLSPHITIKQFEYSLTAKMLKLKNVMNNEQISNAVLLANNVVEKILAKIGGNISSGFRGVELNKALKATPTSQHCKGQAVDLNPPRGMNVLNYFKKILALNLPFDQIILEKSWVHISYSSRNRREKLQAYTDDHGQIKYRKYVC